MQSDHSEWAASCLPSADVFSHWPDNPLPIWTINWF